MQVPFSFLKGKVEEPTLGTFWEGCMLLCFKALKALSATISPTSHMLKVDLFVNNILKCT